MAKSYRELGAIVRKSWQDIEKLMLANDFEDWPKNEHHFLDWIDEEEPFPDPLETQIAELLKTIVQTKNQLSQRFLDS